jgi:uncharacterized surface protein with fasciclin (FAS1) repeats
MQFLNSLNDLSVQDEYSETKYRGGRRDRDERSGSIMEMLAGEKRFSMITEIIERAGGGLRDALDDPNQSVTFFAPTNAALTKFHELTKGGERGNWEKEHEGRVDMPKMEDVCFSFFDIQHAITSQIVQYHIVNKQYPIDCLYDGQLLVTDLKQRELGDNKYQRINVSRRLGSIYLNMFTRVEETGLTKASNGYVHAVGM